MVKRDGVWIEWTYKRYYEEARIVAKAFISLGLERHCSVGILGYNSPEWFISQMGAILAGGISTGIYTTNRFVVSFVI
jgi:long-chain-fatty-acid--CoA ligase ACSBG